MVYKILEVIREKHFEREGFKKVGDFFSEVYRLAKGVLLAIRNQSIFKSSSMQLDINRAKLYLKALSFVEIGRKIKLEVRGFIPDHFTR